MTNIIPGARITARCTRCKDITGHIIVIALNNEIIKVECVACKSQHKYYPPEIAKKASPVKATRTTAIKSASQKLSALENSWKDALKSQTGQIKEYSISGTFNVKDIINHSIFGQGKVIEIILPNKMSVIFKDGTKTLRCAN